MGLRRMTERELVGAIAQELRGEQRRREERTSSVMSTYLRALRGEKNTDMIAKARRLRLPAAMTITPETEGGS